MELSIGVLVLWAVAGLALLIAVALSVWGIARRLLPPAPWP